MNKILSVSKAVLWTYTIKKTIVMVLSTVRSVCDLILGWLEDAPIEK